MKVKKTLSCIVLLVLLISVSVSVYADYYGGTRTLVDKGTGKYVEVYANPSISENGYSDIFGNALEEWTGISSQMSGVWQILSSNSTCDRASITDTSIAGALGATYYYKKGLLNEVISADYNDNWVYTRMYFYKNQMDAYYLTTAQKIKVFAHEFGHTQKLSHPTTVQASIMNQGLADADMEVTSYDRSQIKAKWGN